MRRPPKVNLPTPLTADKIRSWHLRADPNSKMTLSSAQAIADQKNKDALETHMLLVEAVRLIDSVHAWPIDVSTHRIDIKDGAGIVTTSDPGDIFDTEAKAYEGSNLRIEFGLQAIDSNAFQALVGNSATVQQVCTFLLCHEIFHLSEIKRQKECDFYANAASIGFARGIRPEMNSQWKDVIHALTNRYWKNLTEEKRKAKPRDLQLPSDEVISASDMVSEACADLQALAMYERIYGANERIAFQSDLINLRVADELTNTANYKIGQELSVVLPNLPNLTNETIVIATWQSAKNKIAAAPDVDANLKAQVAGINLVFDQPLEELPTSKSLTTRALRIIGR